MLNGEERCSCTSETDVAAKKFCMPFRYKLKNGFDRCKDMKNGGIKPLVMSS